MKMLGTPRIYGDRTSSACVLAIGVFDGVHIGHRAIIEQAVSQARELGVDAVALTFDPHPAALLAPGRQPDQLTTLDHRARLLNSLGIASLVAWPFDAQFAALSPGDFEEDILRDYFHAKSIWVGENFTYGHKAAGNPSTLRASQFLSEVEVNAEALYSTGTQVASSTVIRNDIESGDVYRAWQLLQRPHVVEGVVVHGDARGRELGYPTANFGFSYQPSIPADGVYAGWLHADGETWPAAISIGTNPTFDGVDRRVEAYALGRTDLELYDKQAAISFGWRLRETLKFNGIDELIVQMSADCIKAAELTRSFSPTF
jgi:riboflavin kinase/FMN adenylyltransferase